MASDVGWRRLLTSGFIVTTFIVVLVWVFHHMGGLGSSGSGLFNWHPFLMTLAVIVVSTHAVTAFRLLPELSRDTRKTIHFLLQTATLFLLTAGIVVVYKYHSEIKVADWYSSHSWVGLMAFSMFLLQYVSGFVVFSKVEYLPSHRFLGISTWLLLMASLLLGLFDKQRLLAADNLFDGNHTIINVLSLFFVVICLLVGHSLFVARPGVPPAERERDVPYEQHRDDL